MQDLEKQLIWSATVISETMHVVFLARISIFYNITFLKKNEWIANLFINAILSNQSTK